MRALLIATFVMLSALVLSGCGDDDGPMCGDGPGQAPRCGDICEDPCGCMACPVANVITMDDLSQWVCRTGDCYQPIESSPDGGT